MENINENQNGEFAFATRCHGVWSEDFVCIMADESVFRFLNCFRQRPLTDFVVEDELTEFKKWWKKLKINQKESTILTLRRADGQERRVYLACLKKEGKNGVTIDVEMTDIYVAAAEFTGLSNEYTKMAMYFEHLNGYFYEYDREEKSLHFYRYYRGIKTEIFDFEYAGIADELSDRLDKISGTPEFIKESFLYNEKELSVDGVALYKEYNLKKIFGRIREKRSRRTDLNTFEQMEIGKLESFTGLWNKSSALDYLRERIENGDRKQVIVAIIDLDYFKIINDTYGHAFGDEVILRMSQILKSVITGRGIASRFGGDEFMLILEDIGPEASLRSIIESVRTQLSWAFNDIVKGQRISCTIGISEYPKNGDDFTTIFNKADRALYIGKQKGKNRYIIYKESIHGELPTGDEEKTLEQGIRDSLKVGEHLSGISSCLTELCRTGTAAIPTVAEKLMTMYLVDRVSIYRGKDLKLLDTFGKYGDPLPDMNMIKKPEVLTLFKEDGVCHVIFDHMNSYFYEDFHGALHKNGVFDSTMFLIGNKHNIKALVCFDRINTDRTNSRKWSDEELHILLLVARLMGELLT